MNICARDFLNLIVKDQNFACELVSKLVILFLTAIKLKSSYWYKTYRISGLMFFHFFTFFKISKWSIQCTVKLCISWALLTHHEFASTDSSLSHLSSFAVRQLLVPLLLVTFAFCSFVPPFYNFLAPVVWLCSSRVTLC